MANPVIRLINQTGDVSPASKKKWQNDFLGRTINHAFIVFQILIPNIAEMDGPFLYFSNGNLLSEKASHFVGRNLMLA